MLCAFRIRCDTFEPNEFPQSRSCGENPTTVLAGRRMRKGLRETLAALRPPHNRVTVGGFVTSRDGRPFLEHLGVDRVDRLAAH
jgi:hypothetical protein